MIPNTSSLYVIYGEKGMVLARQTAYGCRVGVRHVGVMKDH